MAVILISYVTSCIVLSLEAILKLVEWSVVIHASVVTAVDVAQLSEL